MTDIFVESWGVGTPVVLVHGSLATGGKEWQAQRPLALAASLEKSGPPAWKTVPSRFMVARQDHAIAPRAERFMAKRAGSDVTEIDASHAALASQAAAVADVILRAVKATSKKK